MYIINCRSTIKDNCGSKLVWFTYAMMGKHVQKPKIMVLLDILMSAW